MFGKIDKEVHEAVIQERDALKASLETAQGQATTLNGQIETLTSERDTATADLATAQNSITEKDQQIAALTAQLAARPGAPATEVAPVVEKIETTENELSIKTDIATEFVKENL